MYIIIAGGGIAGSTLATELVNRKHDVVVIDTDVQACEDLFAKTGAVTVHGKATEIGPVKEAGIHKADVAIGALYRDVDNLTFALLAHSFGVQKIIVKMRDPAYEEAYRIAGVTTICDMISMVKTRVISELEASGIKLIAPLRHGKTQLVMFQIPAAWPAEGIPIQDLAKKKVFSGDCVFTGILDEDTEQITIPHGQDRVYPGNQVFLVAGQKNLQSIAKFLAEGKESAKNGPGGTGKPMSQPV